MTTPARESFEPRERIPGMSAEYTPERHGGVSVISASIAGLVKTSHHKYAGRRQEPLATAYRTEASRVVAQSVAHSVPIGGGFNRFQEPNPLVSY